MEEKLNIVKSDELKSYFFTLYPAMLQDYRDNTANKWSIFNVQKIKSIFCVKQKNKFCYKSAIESYNLVLRRIF